MKIVLLLSFAFLNFNSYAFNWKECKSKRFRSGVQILGLFEASSSSAEFSTSTGDCAMIGVVKHDRKVFMAYNLDKIQIDAARGKGDYLSTLASLYRCQAGDVEVFSRRMQMNYSKLFNSENNSQKSSLQIDNLVLESQTKMKSCKV